MENLIKFAQETINKYPHLKDDINGLIQLCRDEIEQGESSVHEIELCTNDIEQLIESE